MAGGALRLTHWATSRLCFVVVKDKGSVTAAGIS